MRERKIPSATDTVSDAGAGRRAFLGVAAVAPIAALAASLPIAGCDVKVAGRVGPVSPVVSPAADPAGPGEAVVAVRRFALAREVEPALAFRPLITLAGARDL